LISFLNAVLNLTGDQTITDVEILNPYQAPRIEGLKETILDVRAKDKAGITFIVEMQVEKQEHFAKRVLYYSSKAYSSQIEVGVDYPKLNQVIFIGILNFKIFEGSNYLSRHLILNTATQKQELKDLEFNFIELEKFNKEETDLATIIEKWIYFLKNAGSLKVIPTNAADTVELKEAYDSANQYNWTKEEMDVYDYWSIREGRDLDVLNTAKKDARAEGLAEGEAKGKAEGKAEGLQEALARMVANGMSEKDARTILGI
jgi:predicted transposase/invertase (TIGR01784 family)